MPRLRYDILYKVSGLFFSNSIFGMAPTPPGCLICTNFFENFVDKHTLLVYTR